MIDPLKNINIKQALGILGLVLFAACSTEKADLKAFSEDQNYQFETASNMVLTYSDSACVQMKIEAKTFRRFTGDNSYIEMPDGVIGKTYDVNGRQVSTLTANYAKRFDSDKATHAEGDVVIINIKGDTLNTDRISWFESQDSIYTDAPVVINTPKHQIKGKGLESNSSFSKYRILDVIGILSVEDPEKD